MSGRSRGRVRVNGGLERTITPAQGVALYVGAVVGRVSCSFPAPRRAWRGLPRF